MRNRGGHRSADGAEFFTDGGKKMRGRFIQYEPLSSFCSPVLPEIQFCGYLQNRSKRTHEAS